MNNSIVEKLIKETEGTEGLKDKTSLISNEDYKAYEEKFYKNPIILVGGMILGKDEEEK